MFGSVRLDSELSLVIAGRFDGALAPAVHEAIQQAVADGVDTFLVDVTEATEVDDGAIAVLAAAAVQARVAGGHLFIALGPERIVQIHDASLVRSVFG